MKKGLSVLIFLACSACATAQVFTFACMDSTQLTGINCDVCPVTNITSRSFCGLLIYKNAVPYKWIDQPYTIRLKPGNSVEYLEQIPSIPNIQTQDRVTISLAQTGFFTAQGMIDSTVCHCATTTPRPALWYASDSLNTAPVFDGDTVTIVGRGAATVTFDSLLQKYIIDVDSASGGGGGFNVDSLNYYTCDSTAMADGLAEGDPYLLECNNCYGLPAGLFKVVKICGFDCNYQLRYFPNDSTAVANGIPPGREYVLDEGNLYGILYGFIKVAYPDSIPGGTLECNDDLPEFDNDLDAIMGGRLFGDLYTMTDSNTYGAPEGTERAVSSISSTVADPPNCCDATGRLPFYDNDTAAIGGGLSSGYYYYLDSTNTYGYPYGTKKRIP